MNTNVEHGPERLLCIRQKSNGPCKLELRKEFIFLFTKMVAETKQNKNLTNLTKMLRNSTQFITMVIQCTDHHHTQQFTIKIVT